MKKVFLYIVFFMLMLFVCSFDVEAKINAKNAEIECVYANGIVIGMNYDLVSGLNNAYVKEYPVSESVEVDFQTITAFSLYDVNQTLTYLENFTCPANVRYWIAWQKEGDNKAYRGVYSFHWADTAGNTITSQLQSSKKSGWWIFSSTETTSNVYPVKFKNPNVCANNDNCAQSNCGLPSSDDDKLDGCSPEAIIPLVGERIYLAGDIGDDAYSHTFKTYSSDGDEAVANPRYVQFLVTDSGQYLAQVGQTLTGVDGIDDNFRNKVLNNDSMDVYICVKESLLSQDASRGDSSYKFDSIRHKVQVSSKDGTCPTGYVKYKRTTEVCKIDVGTSAGSFCDKYSNTARELINIIKILQFLVPILVIVFTSIEIARIVIAGNIEEELPKRKKSIIIRFIVMIAFFFLPLMTQIVISLVEGVSILDVSCLFEDPTSSSNQELSNENCVDPGATE